MNVSHDDYLSWDATEMAALVRRGDVSAGELGEACRSLLDRWNPVLNAVGDRAEPGAPGAPGASDPDARFAGVPFAVKELLAWPGLPWTLGSRLFATNPAGPPSPYAERLAAAGLRVVCSTTSSELGLLGSTESALRGVTVNPWAAGTSAGGSSGGSAALVAAGVLPMAHANDGGGSIRVPASMNGLFGFKPSNRRGAPSMPETGGFTDLVVDHCVSRTVRDSAGLLAATERTGADAVHPPVGFVAGPDAARRRIGVLRTTLTGRPPDPVVAVALEHAIATCERLGHDLVELEPLVVDGDALSHAFFSTAALAMAELTGQMTPFLGRAPGPDELEPFTLELVEWAATLPDDAAARARATFADAGAAYLRALERCDVVLSPTLAVPPWPIGHLAPGVGREELVRRTEEAVGYTPIHNIAGAPAMSVPLWWDGDIPIGTQLAAAPGDDALLLALAYELEEAVPWRHRRPTLITAAPA